ncbi:hypothetical protein LguiB_022574 [Lonicera macranthoides]
MKESSRRFTRKIAYSPTDFSPSEDTPEISFMIFRRVDSSVFNFSTTQWRSTISSSRPGFLVD